MRSGETATPNIAESVGSVTDPVDPSRVAAALRRVRGELLAARVNGHWVGELSSSPLATATAISAVSLVFRYRRELLRRETGSDSAAGGDCGTFDSMLGMAAVRRFVSRAMAYLLRTQNADGGWGDCPDGFSNIATTMLVRSALTMAGPPHGPLSCIQPDPATVLARADQYIADQGGVTALHRRYGEDRTFAIPILTHEALAGRLAWSRVTPLPFELATLPHRLLGMLRIPVVSYAIPALVAMGLVRYHQRRSWNPIMRFLRRWAIGPSLRTLRERQPESGGFLEAVPLTAFVVMSLAALSDAPDSAIGADAWRTVDDVIRHGVRFLFDSVREDGSLPIDTNLATWGTTLAIQSLASQPRGSADVAGVVPIDLGRMVRLGATPGGIDLEWLLRCQWKTVHPFTRSEPGGWGWSDLSGAVPDADDTPGALLALAAIHRQGYGDALRERIEDAAMDGLRWLLDLQNRDGGFPTFCRGWGALPFDRSGVDLTAHAVRAMAAWSAILRKRRKTERESFGTRSRARRLLREIRRRTQRAIRFVESQQQPDGSWRPLWFGNQYHPDETNPVYGTARVLCMMRDLGRMRTDAARRGVHRLVACVNIDGGFGGDCGEAGGLGTCSTVEETSLASLALHASLNDPAVCDDVRPVLDRAVRWLVTAIESDRFARPAPIGLYFAKLWYSEKLYPLVFATEALGAILAGDF